MKIADGVDLCPSQPCLTIGLSSRRPSPLDSVRDVVGVSTELEMLWVDAEWNVTRMTHQQPIGDLSVRDRPCNAVRSDMATLEGDLAVGPRTSAEPKPALVGGTYGDM